VARPRVLFIPWARIGAQRVPDHSRSPANSTSSMVFALAHTEQGLVGMALTFIDAVLFAGLRIWFGTLWAPVLAHGMNNTLGLTTYYLIGPVYGLW